MSVVSTSVQRRRVVMGLVLGVGGAPVVPRARAAGEPTFPGRAWQAGDPAGSNWSLHHLKQAEDLARALGTTAVLVVEGGRVLAQWGKIAQPVRVASVRKSLLSALYGIAVAEGKIDLSKTLGELGIDDRPPGLADAEKKATVRDLLTARSGVYHEAASETEKIREQRPPRVSALAWVGDQVQMGAVALVEVGQPPHGCLLC